MKLLIVDDEATTRNILKNHIQTLLPNCEIFEADNGAIAIFQYLRHKPDIVFLDLLMPILGGEIFLEVIEEFHRRKIIPKEPRAVVVTSFNDPEKLVQLSSRASVECVIPKPITHATIERLKPLLVR